MSFKDRFVDGMGSLFERLGDGESLGAVDEEALERELAARVAARKASSAKVGEHPRAQMARAGDKAKADRASMAATRLSRIHGERTRKAEATRRANEEAYKRMAEEARRQPPPSSSQSYARSSQQTPPRTGSARPSIFQNKDLAAHYKTLGVEYGADSATVKKAYRGLMRKYHPDLHSDPKKKKAATELTIKISAAYEAIEKKKS